MLRLGLTMAAMLSAAVVAPTSSSCSENVIVSGGCGVSNDGTSINITDERTVIEGRPRTDTHSPIEAADDRGPSSPLRDQLCERSITHLRLCRETPTDPTAPPTADPGLPAITITDLAQFAPAPTSLAGEPANLGIVGMPTNFVASASVTTASGTLFDRPIVARFTPAAYDFHFGDGTDATTTSGGQTWEALGQAQFTPTTTSHAYRERGTYSADVDVRYTAEVDLGTGWIPVAGQLTADGPTQQIRIFEAHTALVAYTCDQKPSSAGC